MKRIIILLLLCLVETAGGQSLRVVSYNIRYANASDAKKGDGWERRCPVLCVQLLSGDFDLAGCQEVLKSQLDDLMESLSEEYGVVGAGRDDGREKGEYVPIFYRRERFELLGSGHFWLSESPDRPAPGWDAKYPRICSWVRLRERTSGRRLLFLNTHFDHVGTRARSESARLILRRTDELSDGGEAILTGDFNVDQHSPGYRVLTSGRLRDAFEAAQIRMAETGTVNGFDVNRQTPQRIDHVLVTPGLEVEHYEVRTGIYWTREPGGRTRARTPSDHYPVCVKLSLK